MARITYLTREQQSLLDKANLENKVEKWKPLQNNTVLSEVDLIVPFHGQYERLSQLIETLWATTSGIFYNLCLVDDASPNSDFLDQIQKKNFPSVFCIRHDEQKGFGAAINTGLKATKSPWVVILNSDVEFKNGFWLTELGKTYQALRDKNVKMVSSRYNNVPPGDRRIDMAINLEEDVVIVPEEMSQIVDEDAFLPFVCVLAHRELFTRVGLVKEYPLGWYEDLEFACRMHAQGFKQAVSIKSTITHAGSATVDEVCTRNKKLRKVFDRNYDTCCQDIKSLKRV